MSPTLAPDDPRHGTNNGYGNLGCRCDACRAAATEYQRQWAHRSGYALPRDTYLAELQAQPPPPHGTESRYVSERCRCAKCRRASANARFRRRVAASVTVHNRSGYSNGCRCDVCREANRVYTAARRSTA